MSMGMCEGAAAGIEWSISRSRFAQRWIILKSILTFSSIAWMVYVVTASGVLEDDTGGAQVAECGSWVIQIDEVKMFL